MDQIFLTRTDMIKPPLHPKEQMRGDIEEQIKSFFAQGGKIQELPPGRTQNYEPSFTIPKREIL